MQKLRLVHPALCFGQAAHFPHLLRTLQIQKAEKYAAGHKSVRAFHPGRPGYRCICQKGVFEQGASAVLDVIGAATGNSGW